MTAATFGSVRVRMTVAATLLVTVALGAASWILVASVRASLRDNLRNESALALTEAYERLERGYPLDRLPRPGIPGFTILVVDGEGEIVGGSPGHGSGPWSDWIGDDDSGALVGENGRPFPGAVTHERTVWFVDNRIIDVQPILINATEAYLVAAGPGGTIDQSIHTLTSTLWLTLPVLIVLVAGVAWLVTGRALRPVETIRAEVTAISHSSLDQRVSEPRARDEVGRLARTMNEMLDRLQDSSDRQRQFVSDASHELRSPVAAIRATGEVALAHPEQADWETVVRRMLTEDDRMEQIVGTLLEVARGEEAPIPFTTVDLDDVVLDEVARARGRGRRVLADGVSAGRVLGNPEQLTRVVRNLLDNALRHATGTVRVSLTTDDASVSLVVEDDGPGIAATDREAVFERFTRLDEGRARDAGGLGLGLAMVRAIAERHGGTAAITDATDPAFPGARIVVTLPVAA
jgi:signal transduction histidine kinase